MTSSDINYQGSLTLDASLMLAADILPHEQVHVLNLTNGERLVTYAIEGPPGSGIVQANGAAAHVVQADDILIVLTYAEYDEDEVRNHTPIVIHLDDRNRPVDRGLRPVR